MAQHKKEWSIQAAEIALMDYLAACNSDFERSNVIAIHGMEQRQRAERKGMLSPVERAIVEKYGYRNRPE